jgi:hypothetical protein
MLMEVMGRYMFRKTMKPAMRAMAINLWPQMARSRMRKRKWAIKMGQRSDQG